MHKLWVQIKESNFKETPQNKIRKFCKILSGSNSNKLRDYTISSYQLIVQRIDALALEILGTIFFGLNYINESLINNNQNLFPLKFNFSIKYLHYCSWRQKVELNIDQHPPVH